MRQRTLTILAVALGSSGTIARTDASVIYVISSTQMAQVDVDALTVNIKTAPMSLFNAAGGPLANTPYVTSGASLYLYDFAANTASLIGGSVPGNSMGGAGGTLYSGAGGSLYSVNQSNGISTLIGSGSGGYAGDLAGIGSTLYGSIVAGSGSSLVKVNQLTGAQSVIATYPSQQFWGLASTADGRLFGGTGSSIYQINPVSGAITFHMNVNVAGGAYDMASEVLQVPGPGVLAGCGVCGFLAARRRRRRDRSGGHR